MLRTLTISVSIVAILGIAVTLRLHDAPYIAFVEGRPAAATDGLREKAERGDGFAAFLLARNDARGIVGTPETAAVAHWYWTAARLGEIRAIAPYIAVTFVEPPSSEQCRAIFSLLELAGRAGEPAPLIMLGHYHEIGFCTQTNLALAARYYMGAGRIDGRLNDYVDAVAARLDPEAVGNLRAIPERFDAKPGEAVARFLAEMPPPAKPGS
jgi:hypothetical protein